MEELFVAIQLEVSYQLWISTQGTNYDSRIDYYNLMYYPGMCDCMDCSIAGEPTH